METKVGNISAEQLKRYIESIEDLENQKREVLVHIKEMYDRAKSEGFEPKVMRQIIRARKMDEDELSEQESLLEVYKKALGM